MDVFAFDSLQRRLNYVKLVFLFLDVGASVLVKTFEYLYQGSNPPNEHLVSLAKVKSNNIYAAERETLERLKEGELKLNQLDITLTYKLIQLTCGLTDRNSPEGRLLWSKQCPNEKKQCLEHLLFRYKEMRNKIIHDFKEMDEEICDDAAFEVIKNKSETLLIDIVKEVKVKTELTNDVSAVVTTSGLTDEATETWLQQLKLDINNICQWDVPTSGISSKDYIKDTPSKGVGGLELDIYISRSKSRMGVPRIRKMSIFKGDLIKREILRRYGDELPNHGAAYRSSPLPVRKISDPSPFTKSDRNYWIDRLLVTDVLDDDCVLERFVEEYSKEKGQHETIFRLKRLLCGKFN